MMCGRCKLEREIVLCNILDSHRSVVVMHPHVIYEVVGSNLSLSSP